MKVEPPFFDRGLWEGYHSALASPGLAPAQRSHALQQVRASAPYALQALRSSQLPARHDIKLVKRTLQVAVRQRSAAQPVLLRLVQAVWRWLRLPDSLAQQQRQACLLARRSEARWCAEEERFLTTSSLLLEEQASGRPDPLQPEDRAFFGRYTRKMHKRLLLLDAYKNQKSAVADVIVQLLRIQRGMKKEFAPERLAELLDKATTLRAGNVAAPFTVEDFGFLSFFDEALEQLLTLNSAGLLPKTYNTTLRLLQELHEFAQLARQEIAADRQCRPGDIEFDDYSLAYRSHNAAMGWYEHGFMAITRSAYVHASLALHAPRTGTTCRAEMAYSDGFRLHTPGLDEMLASSAYRLDWHRLVTKAGQASLETTWGPDWAAKLQHVFENRITRLLRAPPLKSLRFDENINAVPFRIRWQRQPEPLQALPKASMFCSEFVARALAVTLHDIEATLRANDEDLREPALHRVFSRHENYKAVSPGHLERRLKPVTLRVPPATALRKYVGHREDPAGGRRAQLRY